ncbi:hypothetical protein [Idiomarina sp. HP20-50]|uniref:hypothetical protein n=1 Tax=Idiomarina sp. HP20-50 TaxID=3070813 RepID=UPI00294B70B0|nr:hypothetical protein [Idiomarina sp. HP20-50]MDV6315162.1 hypothetical protein [Idiomarina sp. HP20-50]
MTKSFVSCLAYILSLALLLTLSANAYTQETSDNKSLFPESTTDEWMSASYYETYRKDSEPHNLTDYLTAFGSDEDAIRNQLGEPLNRYVEEVPNRHNEDETNTEVTLEYDGLVIRLMSWSHKTFITDIYIDNCQLNSPFQSYLCQPVTTIKKRLGKPTVTTGNELIYTTQYGDMGTAPLRLGIKNNKIRWIYVRNYID